MFRSDKFRKELQNKAEANLSSALSDLERSISSPGPKRKKVIELKHQLNALEQDHQRGLIDEDIYEQRRQELLGECTFLASGLSRSSLKPQPTSGTYQQRGKIRYWIAEEMQYNQLTSCIIRLSDGSDLPAKRGPRKVKNSNHPVIQVAEVVAVNLVDSNDTPAFEVRSQFYKEQFITKDNYAVWNFRVKPIQKGTHVLKLQVGLIEMIDGVAQQRDIEVEKTVIVGSRIPPPNKQGKFLTVNTDLRYTSYAAQPFTAKKRRTGKRKKKKLAPVVGPLNVLHLLGLAVILAALGWLVTRVQLPDLSSFTAQFGKEEVLEPIDPKNESLLPSGKQDSGNGKEIPGNPRTIDKTTDPDLPTVEEETKKTIAIEPPTQSVLKEEKNESEKPKTLPSPFVPPQVRMFVDNRDNKVYRVIQVGNQWWLADNLNYQVKGNNNGIPASMDVVGKAGGKYYTANAVVDACPPGWKLPTGAEWKKMLTLIPITELQKLLSSARSGDAGNVAEAYRSLLSGWVINRALHGVGESGNYWYAAGNGNVQSIEINYPRSAGFFSMQGISSLILEAERDKLLLPCRCIYNKKVPDDNFSSVSLGSDQGFSGN